MNKYKIMSLATKVIQWIRMWFEWVVVLNSDGYSEVLFELGAIKATLSGIATQLENLPCAENTKTLTEVRQRLIDHEEYDEKREVIKKDFKSDHKEREDKKFKLNAQAMSIIALVISILVGINAIFGTIVSVIEKLQK